jgi:ketosteroid isomerase-like protein
MSQENVEMVREFVHAFNRGDDDAAISHAHPDFAFLTDLPERNAYRGRKGLGEYRRDLDGAFQEWRFDHHRFVEAPEGHVLQFFRLVVQGQPTGTQADWEGATLWTISDRKVAAAITFRDQTDALEAAGLRE